MRPSDTSVRGLKLLVYEALSYSVRATLFFLACLSTWRHASPIVTTMKKCQIFFLVRSRELLELVLRPHKQGALTAVSSNCYLLLYMCPHTGVVEGYPSSCVLQRPVYAFRCAPFFSLLHATISVSSYRCPDTSICVLVHASFFFFIFWGEWKNV